MYTITQPEITFVKKKIKMYTITQPEIYSFDSRSGTVFTIFIKFLMNFFLRAYAKVQNV